MSALKCLHKYSFVKPVNMWWNMELSSSVRLSYHRLQEQINQCQSTVMYCEMMSHSICTATYFHRGISHGVTKCHCMCVIYMNQHGSNVVLRECNCVFQLQKYECFLCKIYISCFHFILRMCIQLSSCTDTNCWTQDQ